MEKRLFAVIAGIVFIVIVALVIMRVHTSYERPKDIPDANTATPSALLKYAKALEAKGDLIKARDSYQSVIARFPNSKETPAAMESLWSLNVKILFSPVATGDSTLYEVQKGDSLTKIAKKFNTTIELISKANGLKGTNIRPGQKLKITKATFSVAVDKSQNILTLKADGNIIKTYRVSTGRDNSTPVGHFTVTNKIVNPTWFTTGAIVPPNSPKNILGSRWIGISKKSYGIHGTTEPDKIGESVTSGCVRLTNSDAEELYSIVPEGTEVVIVD
jgi:lipoprotein-anchoring transpeptidase ErfK/SrfK